DVDELIETLSQMYEEVVADLREDGRQAGLQDGRQEGLQEGRQEGLQEGEKQATRRLITNLFRVRFGEADEQLTAIIPAIAALPSEEFTPLLLQLSREELLTRFSRSEDNEQ
ncbi:MAG: hypothetical protein AB4290_00760, partial [Spirulina sp.]